MGASPGPLPVSAGAQDRVPRDIGPDCLPVVPAIISSLHRDDKTLPAHWPLHLRRDRFFSTMMRDRQSVTVIQPGSRKERIAPHA